MNRRLQALNFLRWGAGTSAHPEADNRVLEEQRAPLGRRVRALCTTCGRACVSFAARKAHDVFQPAADRWHNRMPDLGPDIGGMGIGFYLYMLGLALSFGVVYLGMLLYRNSLTGNVYFVANAVWTEGTAALSVLLFVLYYSRSKLLRDSAAAFLAHGRRLPCFRSVWYNWVTPAHANYHNGATRHAHLVSLRGDNYHTNTGLMCGHAFVQLLRHVELVCSLAGVAVSQRLLSWFERPAATAAAQADS